MSRRHPRTSRWERPVSLLQAARFAHRWDQWEVCRRIRAICPGHKPDIGCRIEPSKLSDYEHGKRFPGMKHVLALCKLYDRSPEQLGLLRRGDMPAIGADGPSEANGTENSSGTNLTAVSYATPSEASDSPEDADTPRGRWDDDLLLALLLRVLLGEGSSDQMRRDQFVKGVGAAAGAAFIDPFVFLSQQAQDELNHTKVSRQQVQRLTGAAYDHARNFPRLDNPEYLRPLLSDWVSTQRLLELPSTLSQRNELTNVYARLSGILGFYTFDSGYEDRARSLYRTAQEAARESGDSDLVGWLLEREAEIPGWDPRGGRPTEAIELAMQGLLALAGSNTLTAGKLHGQAALAAASLSDRRAARTHLEAAERALSASTAGCWPNEAMMPAGFVFTESRHARTQARTSLRIGDYTGAIAHCQRAAALIQQQSAPITSAVATNQIWMSTGLLHTGELDGAVEIATNAVSSYSGVGTSLVLRTAGEFERDLVAAAPGSRHAREFSEFLGTQSA